MTESKESVKITQLKAAPIISKQRYDAGGGEKWIYIVTCAGGDRYVTDTSEEADAIVDRTRAADIDRLFKDIEQSYWIVEGSFSPAGFTMDILGKCTIEVRASDGYKVTVRWGKTVLGSSIIRNYDETLSNIDGMVRNTVTEILDEEYNKSVPKRIDIKTSDEQIARTKALGELRNSYKNCENVNDMLELLSFYVESWRDADCATSNKVAELCSTYF